VFYKHIVDKTLKIRNTTRDEEKEKGGKERVDSEKKRRSLRELFKVTRGDLS